MKLTILIAMLFALCATVLARPQYKDIDYKMFDEDDGVAVDVVHEQPPPHHHHKHHKKLVKTNRLERLKRFLQENNTD